MYQNWLTEHCDAQRRNVRVHIYGWKWSSHGRTLHPFKKEKRKVWNALYKYVPSYVPTLKYSIYIIYIYILYTYILFYILRLSSTDKLFWSRNQNTADIRVPTYKVHGNGTVQNENKVKYFETESERKKFLLSALKYLSTTR